MNNNINNISFDYSVAKAILGLLNLLKHNPRVFLSNYRTDYLYYYNCSFYVSALEEAKRKVKKISEETAYYILTQWLKEEYGVSVILFNYTSPFDMYRKMESLEDEGDEKR